MTDLEQQLRNALEDEGRAAPAPHEIRPALRRVRRRQTLTVITSVGCVVVIAVMGFVGFTTISDDDGGTPAATTTTGTLNGISITYPEDWALIDPDAAGLNGGPGAGDELPRLVLFLSPAPADDMLACPAMESAAPRWFVISVQEEPLALAGDAATPWPVRPTLTRTLPDSGCYPGWDFLETRWTAAGRTFDGRIGIAPVAGAVDRAAVLDAFSSMTFEGAAQTATSAVVADGTIDGEHWEVIASTSEGGLELTLQSETFGTGGIGDPTSDRLRLMDHEFGEGPEAQRVVFSAVPASVAHLNVTDEDSDARYEVIDIPDAIDPDQNAFVITVPPEMSAVVSAFDPRERLIASGRIRGSDGIPVVAEEDDPLPDGLHFGFVRSVDPGGLTLAIDVATWLTGDEADAAWQAAGNTGSVPNDFFVENEDPAVATLPLAPDARIRLLDWNACCDTFFNGDLGAWSEAIATQADVERGGRLYRGVSSWWVTVEDGVVVRVEERYTP